jgi:hypothetical protein
MLVSIPVAPPHLTFNSGGGNDRFFGDAGLYETAQEVPWASKKRGTAAVT